MSIHKPIQNFNFYNTVEFFRVSSASSEYLAPMLRPITKQIEIKVTTQYLVENSDPELDYYVFSYHITIVNNSDETVQLKRRHWYIFDSAGRHHQVEGAGVVGEQPVLMSGESHSYTSGCHFQSPQGFMRGYFTFEREIDGSIFRVPIRRFAMAYPPICN